MKQSAMLKARVGCRLRCTSLRRSLFDLHNPTRSVEFRRSFSWQKSTKQAQVIASTNISGDDASPLIDASKPIGRFTNDHYQTRVSNRVHPRIRPDPAVWSDSRGPLSHSDLESYDRNGFLQIKQLLDDADIAALTSDIQQVTAEPSFMSDPRCVLEKSSQDVRSIFEIHRLSPVLKKLLTSSKLTSIARQILGSEVYIHQSRINFKPAFTGKGFYWHSDFETWHAEDGMPVPRALSFSISLTENTLTNGPLMIIPGSHKTFVSCIGETPENHHLESLREQEIGVPDRESITTMVQRSDNIAILTGPPGSAVMFDSNCMHGSCDNIAPFGRCNLFIVFNSMENTLGKPYYATTRRPDYIAATNFTPV